MADFAALPLFTDAYLADCGHLSDAEHGRYLLLLMLMWRSPGCRVPNDLEWLGRKLRRSPGLVDDQIMPLVREFCDCSGNWITQKRLAKEYEYVLKNSRKQSDIAKSRWNKEKTYASAMPESESWHASGNAPSPTPTLSPTDSPLSPPTGGQERKAQEGHERRRRRRDPPPIPTNCGAGVAADAPWQQRLANYKPGGMWLPNWGPRPESEGCYVPAEILASWRESIQWQ